MPANARVWGAVIAVVAIILIVLSFMVLTQQIQNAPVPTPTGDIPTVTVEKTQDSERTSEAVDGTATPEATAES